MRIVKKRTLIEYWAKHPSSEGALKSWYAEVKNANWTIPQDIKKRYSTADILSNNRVVFNIKGNTYRLAVEIHYNTQIVYIRFVGTHSEYDRIDAEKI